MVVLGTFGREKTAMIEWKERGHEAVEIVALHNPGCIQALRRDRWNRRQPVEPSRASYCSCTGSEHEFDTYRYADVHSRGVPEDVESAATSHSDGTLLK